VEKKGKSTGEANHHPVNGGRKEQTHQKNRAGQILEKYGV